MSKIFRRFYRSGALLLAVLLLGLYSARGAESRGFEVTSIEFEGNATIPAKDLQALMTTQETPGFFNRFLYGISEKLGRAREFLNAVTFEADLERMKRLYINSGFWGARIDTALAYNAKDSTVDILIKVTEGYHSIIDTLQYRGLEGTPPQVAVELAQNPRISQGDHFNNYLLNQELARVLRILNNNGYPTATYVRDSSYARHYASTGNYKIVLTFDHKKIYWFGDIHVRQEVDTLRGVLPQDDVYDDIVIAQMDYKPGDLYNIDGKISSEQNLNRLGIFDLRELSTPVPINVDTAKYIPTFVTIRPRDKHELAPELIISDENGAFNLGAGIGYTQRNFLGGARTFNTRLRFRTQTLREFPNYFATDNDAVANLDLTFEMLQPYIFTNKIRGSWAFSFIVDKQKPYLQDIVRNQFSFNDRFAEFTTGALEWSLESIALTWNPNFRVDSNDTETLLQLRNIQEQQFNSILSFTLQRDMSNDRFSPSEGFIHSATIEEAGLLPVLMRRLRWNIPLTQFYRIDLLGRWYYDLTSHRYAVFGLKLRAGIEDKYGESRADSTKGIPQTHRFFAGGSGSVRGWASRDLIANGNPQFGGNLIIEGSTELRWNMLQALHDGFWDKIWLIGFVDWGNLWPEAKKFQMQDVAIAGGIGLRYDTFFGPFRIDWGFRVYNPAEAPGQRWITQRKLIGQTFKEAVFHFGIGQAF